MPRAYQAVRKTYIGARIEEPDFSNRRYSGNWRRGRKEDACREFDEFVEQERRDAVATLRAERWEVYDVEYPNYFETYTCDEKTAEAIADLSGNISGTTSRYDYRRAGTR